MKEYSTFDGDKTYISGDIWTTWNPDSPGTVELVIEGVPRSIKMTVRLAEDLADQLYRQTQFVRERAGEVT